MWEAIFRSCHSISFGLGLGLWLGYSQMWMFCLNNVVNLLLLKRFRSLGIKQICTTILPSFLHMVFLVKSKFIQNNQISFCSTCILWRFSFPIFWLFLTFNSIVHPFYFIFQYFLPLSCSHYQPPPHYCKSFCDTTFYFLLVLYCLWVLFILPLVESTALTHWAPFDP